MGLRGGRSGGAAVEGGNHTGILEERRYCTKAKNGESSRYFKRK